VAFIGVYTISGEEKTTAPARGGTEMAGPLTAGVADLISRDSARRFSSRPHRWDELSFDKVLDRVLHVVHKIGSRSLKNAPICPDFNAGASAR